jgi:hypothetical protein
VHEKPSAIYAPFIGIPPALLESKAYYVPGLNLTLESTLIITLYLTL